MNNISLAVKYRPTTFDEVVGQESVVKVLKQQLLTNNIKNCYLFTGPSGVAKTTLSRILANEINKGLGGLIEFDAASNSSVEDVRAIIESSNTKSISGEHKIFIVDECVDGNTEVLTHEGFKKFKDLNKDELIAQYTDSGHIEFVKPIDFIKIPYEGPMFDVSFRDGRNHALMSPNHVQPLKYKDSGLIKESYIKDCEFTRELNIIVGGLANGNKTILSALDRLAIAVQADGHLVHHLKTRPENTWQVGFRRVDKITRFRSLLDDLKIKYIERICGKKSNKLYTRFDFNLPDNITKKLNSYFSLIDINYVYAREFLKEILLWDGSEKSGYPGYYCCIDKDNTDFVSAMVTLAGYSASQSVHIYESAKHRPNHTVNWYYKNTRPSTKCSKTEIKEYKDFIYCVKVPSQKFIARAEGFTFITGNCHSLSNQAWQAFLKTLEEPSSKTIFIFCTTEIQKVPVTILNRVQRFDLTKIEENKIYDRLVYICNKEGFQFEESALIHITKLSKGRMRDAISALEKVTSLYENITLNAVLELLDTVDYKLMFSLIADIFDRNKQHALDIINSIDQKGKDLKLFVNDFITFLVDINKYIILKDFKYINIPSSYEKDIMYSINIENNSEFFLSILKEFISLKEQIKYESNIKTNIEITLLFLCK